MVLLFLGSRCAFKADKRIVSKIFSSRGAALGVLLWQDVVFVADSEIVWLRLRRAVSRGYSLGTHDSVRISVMTRRVLLYPGEDGFVVAEVPSLPGCVSQGKTREEALENVREAISLHEEVLRERGEPLPEDNVELVEVAA